MSLPFNSHLQSLSKATAMVATVAMEEAMEEAMEAIVMAAAVAAGTVEVHLMGTRVPRSTSMCLVHSRFTSNTITRTMRSMATTG